MAISFKKKVKYQNMTLSKRTKKLCMRICHYLRLVFPLVKYKKYKHLHLNRKILLFVATGSQTWRYYQILFLFCVVQNVQAMFKTFRKIFTQKRTFIFISYFIVTRNKQSGHNDRLSLCFIVLAFDVENTQTARAKRDATEENGRCEGRLLFW